MFYQHEYLISVEIDATTTINDLRSALQEACDEGAEFQFQILSTKAPSFIVLFLRDAAADYEYIAERMESESEDACKRAALQQLAAEIGEFDISALDSLVAKLEAEQATLLSYGSLDNIKPSTSLRFLEGPEVLENVRHMVNGHTGGLYMVVVRSLGLSMDSIMAELRGIALDHGFDPKGDITIGDWQPHGADAVTNAVWFHDRLVPKAGTKAIQNNAIATMATQESS